MYDTITGLLKDQKVPASVLLVLAFTEYGKDCLDWEPEILRAELSDDFGVELSDSQSDKLQAAITIFSTDSFEHDWHCFNTCVHVINSEPVYYDTYDPVSAEQIASALPEINIIRSQFTDSGLTFSDEVNVYVGFIFSEYGLLFTPPVFPTAIMPNLQGEHFADSQTEKIEVLDEVYSVKKKQIEEYLDKLKNCYIK